MSDFKEILETSKSEAILTRFQPNESSIWRSIAREYSRTFFTPLWQVLELKEFSMEHVILNILEHRFSTVKTDENLDQFLEDLLTIEDPSYKEVKAKEIAELIKNAEKNQGKLVFKKGMPVQAENKVDFSSLKE